MIRPQSSQPVLDTTQVMKVGSGEIRHYNNALNHDSNSAMMQANTVGNNMLQQVNMMNNIKPLDGYNNQVQHLQNALNDQFICEGQNIQHMGGNIVAKDIDILDSEFAQEESRQIEAYYRSIHKESSEQLKKGDHSSSLNHPRRSSRKPYSSKRNESALVLSPKNTYHQKGYQQPNRSMTERKLIGGVYEGVSRLDAVNHQTSQEGSQNQTINKSQMSKSSRRSARQVNTKAVAQARNHLQQMQYQRRLTERKQKKVEEKKKMINDHKKNVRDELYLSNKLTRQFIMVTSLVMQSEDLSEDSIFNYAQYTEFAIRFGLMSEKAAGEESDERALLYEMWCTLSRVHSDFAFIKVVNLKTMITAILGFPIAIHRNPANMQAKRAKPQQTEKLQKQQRQNQRNQQIEEEPDYIVQEEETQKETSEESGFNDADEDEIPTENYMEESKNELRASRQPINIGGNSSKRDTNQSCDSFSTLKTRLQPSDPLQVVPQPHSIIDEYEELRAAENGQLSSPEESQNRRYNARSNALNQNDYRHQQEKNKSEDEDEYNQEADSQKYFFDQDNQEDQEKELTSDEGELEDDDQCETTSQNEYAIDRAHKIGFFIEHFEFCMSLKDVKTVQRRFKLFQKNWREFQKKDLIVKKSVIIDDGATFQPRINKKSDQMVREKVQGSMEFPMSNNARSDQKSQRRQKIWERDLPKGVKSKERINQISELEQDSRGNWLMKTEQSIHKGVPLYHNVNSRELLSIGTIENKNNQQISSDYFALGAQDHHLRTFASGNSKASSGKSSTNKGPKALTNPQMTQRMEHIYQLGRHKLANRQDIDKESKDFEKNSAECTFIPQISSTSKKISMQRSFSKEDKPWLQPALPQSKPSGLQTSRNNGSAQSQQQIADRMQLSIQKDIQRKKIAQRDKQIKDNVISHGGWPKDYARQLQMQEDQQQVSQMSSISTRQNLKPAFKTYDGKNSVTQKKLTQSATPKVKREAPGRKSTRCVGNRVQQQETTSQDYQSLYTQQRYPITTNTSTQNLQGNGHSNSAYQNINEENATQLQNINQNQNNLMHFTSEDGNRPSAIPTNSSLIQQNTFTMQDGDADSHQRVREQTPNRGMAQQLETGGIQHSGDEQGRAPLESQSSLMTTKTNSLSQTMTNMGGGVGGSMHSNSAASKERGAEITTIPTDEAFSTPSQTQMLQKAMEELTVIQETTFEQTVKGQNMSNVLAGCGAGASSEMASSVTGRGTKPLLFIEVDTNGAEEGGIERIEVYKGDDPRKLAQDFCKLHDYDEGTQIVLQRQIEEKLARAYAKLEDKMKEKRQNRLAEKFRERQAQRTTANKQ